MNKSELDTMKAQVADIRTKHKEIFVAARLYKMLKKATEALEAKLQVPEAKPTVKPTVAAPFGYLANGKPRQRRPYTRSKSKKVETKSATTE